MSLKTNKNLSIYAVPGLLNNKKHDLSIKQFTIEEVAEVVAKHRGVSVAEMRKKDRHGHIVTARQITCYICNKLLPKTFSQNTIGAFFQIDHATVCFAGKSVRNLMETNKEFQYNTILIFQELNL